MGQERERQVKAEQQAAEEEAAQIEAVRRVVAMKAEIQAAAMDLDYHILDWLHIAFRFISDGYSEKSLKLQISYWFRLVQIDSSDFILDFRI